MTPAIVLTILSLGLGRGFLHALDPDHIMTISALSSRQSQNGIIKPVHYAVIWSVGHGIMIFAVASMIFLTGQHLPDEVFASAEFVVGIILIMTGASVLWSIRSRPPEDQVSTGAISSSRFPATPLMIGFVHGLAGSASLLALIPIALLELGSGLAFVLVFCVGVLSAMIVFSLLYDRIQNLLKEYSPNHIMLLQIGVGLGSICLGAFWLIKG